MNMRELIIGLLESDVDPNFLIEGEGSRVRIHPDGAYMYEVEDVDDFDWVRIKLEPLDVKGS